MGARKFEMATTQTVGIRQAQKAAGPQTYWRGLLLCYKCFVMPWYNGDYPPSYKNQPVKLREKAVEIANKLLEDGADEGVAIATGLKRAREAFSTKKNKAAKTDKPSGKK
jgi:hypothetical protein